MDKEINYLKKYVKPSNLPKALTRLKQGEPVQYIVGHVDFYGFNFKVNSNTLIPRFETEELVEKTVYYIKKHLNESVKVIDLGTGTGCIAITLKKLLPKINVSAVDISSKALKVAKENAILNNVDITLYKSNMLDKIDDKYDVIISNPPYISYNEQVMDIVKNNEPHIALYADNNGLQFYENILSNAYKNINEKAIIAFEIGYLQGKSVKEIALKYFPDSYVLIKQDLQGKDRFVFILIGG